jgi:hypothetical protein
MQMRDPFDLLPLRQLVSATGGAERVFAQQVLLDQLSRAGRFRIIRHGGGAEVLAANERALAEARSILRQAYGSAIAFGAAAVHTFVDGQTGERMVPILFVRIDAPRAHAHALQQMLKDRGAAAQDVTLSRGRVVIRVEIAFTSALDLESAVALETEGAAQFLCWLVRYDAAAESDARRKGVVA